MLDAAPDVARLLTAASGVRLLVTSRSVLGLRGEHDVALGPLATPSPGDTQLTEVADSPAVQVFVARAQEVRPGFALSADNAAAIAEVCRRLDGIPLALEVAAARVRMLQPAALLRRLGDRLDLLAGQVDLPQRQRTLRATIDWSHSLLDDDERALFARLSVFADGWTLEGAEAVGTVDGDLDALETLSALVGQSLVAVDERPEGDPRFHMLETVREYAGERLGERGEDAATWRRLADHLTRLSERAGPALSRPENRTWLALLDDELDNLRAALRRAIHSDDPGTVVRIASPLWLYWWTRGQLAAMLALAEETAVLPSAAHLDRREQALLLWCRGTARIALGRAGDAVPLLRRFLSAARDLGDEELLAHALRSLGLALSYDAAPEEPRALLEESVTIARRLGDTFGIAFALTPLGGMALRDGDVPKAIALHSEALSCAEQVGSDYMRGQVLNQLGLDSFLTGDVAGARAWFVASAQVHAQLLDEEGLAYCLDGFAGLALAAGQPEVAARLIAASAHLREVIDVAVWPLLRPMAEGLVAAVSAALDADTYARERAAGAALGPAAALAFALEATTPSAEGAGQQAG